jgi:hypothetical protein
MAKNKKDRNNDEWQETHFKLSNGTLLKIFHNLPNQINDAFQNWIVRTDVYTEESFCKYINDKSKKFTTGHIAYTENEYKAILESLKGSE